LARIVAFAVKVTVVAALFALANVAAAPPVTTVQLLNVWPPLAVTDMLNGVLAATSCWPDGVTVPPVPALTVSVCVAGATVVCVKLARTVAFAVNVTVVDALPGAAIVAVPAAVVTVQPVNV
jgi:hypothetical protein